MHCGFGWCLRVLVVASAWVGCAGAGPAPQTSSSAGVAAREVPPASPVPAASQQAAPKPFAVVGAHCAYVGKCPAGSPLVVHFTAELDDAQELGALVTVTPSLQEIDGNAARLVVLGDSLGILGETQARTTYTVTISGALRDQQGRTLGRPEVVQISVRDAEPQLQAPTDMMVLQRDAATTISVASRGIPSLRVRLYRVDPERLLEHFKHPHREIGVKVHERMVAIDGEAYRATAIDLRPALPRGVGHVVARISAHPWAGKDPAPEVVVWVQATALGLDALADKAGAIVLVSSLGTGQPTSGVEVSATFARRAARTGADGLARLPRWPDRDEGLVVARRAEDVAVLPVTFYGTSRWTGAIGDPLAFFVTTDREVAKPGEELAFKAWVRGLDEHGGVMPMKPQRLRARLLDERRTVVAESTQPSAGSFAGKLTIPLNAALGSATLEIDAAGQTSRVRVELVEARRPDFEVTLHPTSSTYFAGDPIEVIVKAAYFSGMPLARAEVSWHVEREDGAFAPPGLEGYVVGAPSPRSWRASETMNQEGTTDARGKHSLRIPSKPSDTLVPQVYTVNARIADVDRQRWAASTRVLVHPAERAVGLRQVRTEIKRGGAVAVEVRGVDLAGEAAVGAPIEVIAEPLRWSDHGWAVRKGSPQRCSLVSRAAPSRCVFSTSSNGRLRVSATISDARGRRSQSQIDARVFGDEWTGPDAEPNGELELETEKHEFSVGETAKITLRAPFVPAYGLVSWQRSGVVHSAPLTVTEHTSTIEVPITEALVPNLEVQVLLNGKGPSGEGLSTRAEISLAVSSTTRALKVEVAAKPAVVSPEEQTTITAVVRDHLGHPVKDAEVTVFVVDEAVLSMMRTVHRDPLHAFYYKRASETTHVTSRSSLAARYKTVSLSAVTSGGGLAQKLVLTSERKLAEEIEQAQRAPDLRLGGAPLAAFVPAAKTRADGTVEVSVKLSGTLTKYRIVAFAAHGAQRFGKGEAAVTVQRPLIVRPSPPRFLRVGDAFHLPVSVQNQTAAPLAVRLDVRATSLAMDGVTRELTVPANDRVTVELAGRAEAAGPAKLQLTVASGNLRDGVEVSVPVSPPTSVENVATYGVLEQGAAEHTIAVPPGALPEVGGLAMSASSTQLGALTDALLYVVEYPHECAEQRSSRVLSIAALRDAMRALSAAGLPAPEVLAARVRSDIAKLAEQQHDDGGFSFWREDERSLPYITAFVTYAMAHAKAKGYPVPEQVLRRAQAYLADVERRFDARYPPDVHRSISAFALLVRSELGDVDVAKAKRLMAEAKGAQGLPLDAAGWLLSMLARRPEALAERRELVRFMLSRVSETAGAAHFEAQRSEGDVWILSSDTRTESVWLDALMREQRDHALIPKLIAGLLAQRENGRWDNTQDNTFATLALDRAFQTYEKTRPDFVARMWLGERNVGERAFRSHSAETFEAAVSMADLKAAAPAGSQTVKIEKQGSGRLYYRLGLRHAPADPMQPALDRGFAVTRSYEPIDAPDDVVALPDGAWRIKAGARVRVRLKMTTPGRRLHVALVDPLPAGLEALQPKLAITEEIPDDPQKQRDSYWYEHQALRDDRAAAFTSELAAGNHTYSYVARATTRGTFIAPPANAEEMYAPETFGRSPSLRVVVQ